MIDKRQRKAIELIVSGEHTMTRVSELVGVSRTSIYNWMNDEEFNTELSKRTQQIKNMAQKEFDTKLNTAIDLYWKLATDENVEARTRQVALSQWIDRSLGKTTSKLEMSDNRVDKNISEDDILADIDEIEKEVEE